MSANTGKLMAVGTGADPAANLWRAFLIGQQYLAIVDIPGSCRSSGPATSFRAFFAGQGALV